MPRLMGIVLVGLSICALAATPSSAPAPTSDEPDAAGSAPETAPAPTSSGRRASRNRQSPDSPSDAPMGPTTGPVGFLSAEEAISTMNLPPGFKMEVVAEEPMVEHPVAMSFDADGRMWVAQMPSYMPDMEGTGENAPTGRISILEDTDGDGRADKSTVFLDNLVLPRAIAAVRGGALVGAPPKLFFFRDTDGD